MGAGNLYEVYLVWVELLFLGLWERPRSRSAGDRLETRNFVECRTEVKGSRSNENQSERIDRELIELLNELRVALPGVQVLFAFLLTVPFSQGRSIRWHRLRFRQRDKELILSVSNRMAIAGLGFLAIAMVGAVMLIANFAFSETLTVVSGIIAFLIFGGLWYVFPLARIVEQSD
jgi:hypothetical protein